MTQNLFSDTRDTYNAKVKTTLDNLTKPSSGDNPPFIWPGATTHDLGTLNGKYKPLRGYIRRLNEFYKNMGLDASSISNRKCSFQFQPETVTRNVSGNSYDTQYFFNQNPGQLTVPIPGQSTFSIKLLFNREPEVTSNKYLTFDRRLISSFGTRPSPTIVDNKDSLYIEGGFSPSWVTKIGVLADIMVLDAVIGQGINNETVNIIKKIAAEAAAEAVKNKAASGTTLTDRQLDAQDKNDFTEKASAFWTGAAGANPNLGNQAFLVPTPVRIVLSNNMMVEGFVLQSAVNFHKFSRDFIPTQATVELSVQALYIGFAKKTTMLTQDLPTDENGPDDTTATTSLTLAQNSIKDGLKTLYKGSPTHKKAGQDLLKYLLLADPLHNFSFDMKLSDPGSAYRFTTIKDLTGGVSSFFWTGEIKVWWKSHVTEASNPRLLTRTQATPPFIRVNGAPDDEFLKQWGTASAPYILAEGGGQITEDTEDDFNPIKYIHKIKDATPAQWTVNLLPTVPKPYEEDEFIVQLTININLETGGAVYPVGQTVTYQQTVFAGDDVLFKKATYGIRETDNGN
jgi:hypothetical protein